VSTGRLGAADLSAATDTSLYVVPTGVVASFNVSFCNRGIDWASVRLSLSESATPLASEYLEYDAQVPPNGMLERGGLIAAAGTVIVVRSSDTLVNAVVWGVEE